MDKEEIRRQLPEVPPPGLLRWAQEKLADELGGNYCIFKAERVSRPLYLDEIIEYQSLKPRGSVWAASCTCTACQEDFITAKEPGADNILMLEGEDGNRYTLEPWEEMEPHTHYVREKPGDKFPCPYCGSAVELIHARKLRHGITNQVMVISIQNVDQYTGVFYWIVQRTLSEWGLSEYRVLPRYAYILTERGGLVKYTHMTPAYFGNQSMTARWKVLSGNTDTFDQCYYDYGSINNRKCGGAVYPEYPSLVDCTGEKTGLLEFLAAGGERPVVYLKLWRKYRCLENLCKAGQGYLVHQIIERSLGYYPFKEMASGYIDLSKKKPHEMLRMSRGDFKLLRQMYEALKCEHIDGWKRYNNVIGGSFVDFMGHKAIFRNGLSGVLDCIMEYPGTTPERILNYMEKQAMNPWEVRQLLDTRRMTKRLYDRELTSEELWPRNLRQAHDQVAQMLAAREQKEKSKELVAGFQKVIDRYGALEWSDGDLRVMLPRENEDLIREGDVLRHCVGAYGSTHAQGRNIILFIRRYRRPDRPYYTLNISFSGVEPRRIQLHGYGNERHGKNKEHSHRIPRKVLEFCDRWEREIMRPWWAKNRNTEEKTA